MGAYLPLVAALVSLLVGLVVGKAWERYKLRDGRWLDRRRLRDTPHYMLGLSYFALGDVDRAIDELTQAAAIDPDAREIEMVLGSLLREKGQVTKAIAMHQSLLQRPNIGRMEHAHLLLCLGLDFRRAGFIDRAVEAFTEVRRLDASNRYALLQLEKLYGEQKQWDAARHVRRELVSRASDPSPHDSQVLGFLYNEIGELARRGGDVRVAERSFTTAIDTDSRTAPAYINLGELREQQGDIRGALDTWEQLARALPHRAGLVVDRLERGYAALGTPHRFVEHCERVVTNNPQDWRTRLALARHWLVLDAPLRAFELLSTTLGAHPHNLVIHQEMWRALMALHLPPDLVKRYIDLMTDAVFYLDPHVCVKCHYRSTELLWMCPQCHEWNTFVEERIAPAKDSATSAVLD